MGKLALRNNLQQLMRLHGNLSVSDLARLTNLPQPTLHHILTGATRNPRKKLLATVADYFSISIEQLLGQKSLPNIIPDIVKESLQVSTIPIIEWSSLEHWPLNYLKGLHEREIILDKEVGRNSFALIAKNALLEPMCPENSLLIFDHGKKPCDRDFVLAYMSQKNCVLFNRLFIDNNEKYIKQCLEDGNVILIKLNEDIDRIIGTLIEVRIQY